MAFTVTARHAASGTSSQTIVSGSATPTASSLLIVGATAQSDGVSTAHSWGTPTGGGWTYVQLQAAAKVPWNVSDNTFALSGALWRADVGGSPAAHTITVDPFSATADTANWAIKSLDITGHNTSSPIVQSKINNATSATGDTVAGTVTLDATPTAGNLIVAYFGAGADTGGAPASPTAGAGKTFTSAGTSSTAFVTDGLFYRIADGAESATITCADVGQQVGNWVAAAVEVALATASTPAKARGLYVFNQAAVARASRW